MTTNPIHAEANRLAEAFRALGRNVTVSHSVNRNGDSSSYLSVAGFGCRLRLSDHSSGCTDAFDIWSTDVNELIAQNEAARERGRIVSEQRRAEDAARIERHLAEKTARIARIEAEQRAVGERRRAFFAANNIDFDALRGADRQAARDAFAASEAAR